MSACTYNLAVAHGSTLKPDTEDPETVPVLSLPLISVPVPKQRAVPGV